MIRGDSQGTAIPEAVASHQWPKPSPKSFFCCQVVGWFPKMVGFPNNNGVFLLKMILLGCFAGTTISGNTHIPKIVWTG